MRIFTKGEIFMKKLFRKTDRFLGTLFGAAILAAIVLAYFKVFIWGDPPQSGELKWSLGSLEQVTKECNTVLLAKALYSDGEGVKFEVKELLAGSLLEEKITVYRGGVSVKTGRDYLMFLRKEDNSSMSEGEFRIMDYNAVYEVKSDGSLKGVSRKGDEYLNDIGNTLEDMKKYLKLSEMQWVEPVYNSCGTLSELWEKADNVSVAWIYDGKGVVRGSAKLHVGALATLKGRERELSQMVWGTAGQQPEKDRIYVIFFENRGTYLPDWQLLTRYDSIYPIESEEAQAILKMAGYEGKAEDFIP